MKRILCFLFVFFSVILSAAEAEKISMTIGTTKIIQAPFVIESYQLIPRKTDIVQINVTDKQIRVMAGKVGEVNFVISGGGLQKDYIISVRSNLMQVLRQVRNALEELPELAIDVNGDHIEIKGTVTSPEHWAHLRKVLTYYPTCRSFAQFAPSPETVLNLKKMLIDEGFVFSEDKPKTGELSLKISSNSVILSGVMYSQNDVDKINRILATQTWLARNASPESGKINAIITLSVIETNLAVDIVYVGITESESKQIGGNTVPSGVFSASGLYDIVAGRGSGSSVIGGNINSTVRFLAENGISRMYNAGSVSFTNNDPQGGRSHTGGSTYVKVSGNDNGSLQKIEYGLIINVKGGLISPTCTKLTVDLKNSALLGSDGESYTLAEDSTQQTISCNLGETIIVSGSKKMIEDNKKSGFPYLRNIPVLKWFVSSDTKTSNISKLLILISPRLATNSANIHIPPLDKDMKDVYPRPGSPLPEPTPKNGARYRGWLSWLNWFTW